MFVVQRLRIQKIEVKVKAENSETRSQYIYSLEAKNSETKG